MDLLQQDEDSLTFLRTYASLMSLQIDNVLSRSRPLLTLRRSPSGVAAGRVTTVDIYVEGMAQPSSSLL